MSDDVYTIADDCVRRKDGRSPEADPVGATCRPSRTEPRPPGRAARLAAPSRLVPGHEERMRRYAARAAARLPLFDPRCDY